MILDGVGALMSLEDLAHHFCGRGEQTLVAAALNFPPMLASPHAGFSIDVMV